MKLLLSFLISKTAFRVEMCGLTSILSMLLLLGCSCHSDRNGVITEKEESHSLKDKVKAEQLALDRAKAEGIDIDLYRHRSVIAEEGWMIHFDKKGVSSLRGWPAHFSVLVRTDTTTELYRGR